MLKKRVSDFDILSDLDRFKKINKILTLQLKTQQIFQDIELSESE